MTREYNGMSRNEELELERQVAPKVASIRLQNERTLLLAHKIRSLQSVLDPHRRRARLKSVE